MTAKEKREKMFRELHEKAHKAGTMAGNGHTPTPMVVGQAKGLMSTEIDYSKKTYFVESGVCGFAWIHLPNGRSSFARWAKTELGAHKSYYGGTDIWVRGFGQSMERKEAYASAYSKVLNENGIDSYPQSRMD